MNRVWFLVALAVFTGVANAYETGAREESCDDMKPNHGPDPQTKKFPYTIKLSTHQIPSGGKVTVTITAEDYFKGFFVQGRVGNKAIGHFNEAPGAKLVNCHGSAKTAITHVNKNKKKTIALTWNAPKGLSENVVFWVTIVREGPEFWVGKQSQVLTVGKI